VQYFVAYHIGKLLRITFYV